MLSNTKLINILEELIRFSESGNCKFKTDIPLELNNYLNFLQAKAGNSELLSDISRYNNLDLTTVNLIVKLINKIIHYKNYDKLNIDLVNLEYFEFNKYISNKFKKELKNISNQIIKDLIHSNRIKFIK